MRFGSFLRGVAAVLLLAVFPACTNTPAQSPAVRLATQYAVAKYAEQIPATEKAERLDNIRRIAQAISDTASGEAVTIPLLKATAYTELEKLHLSQADTMLARGLVDWLADELAHRIGEGLLDPTQLTSVSAVLRWVVEAVDTVPVLDVEKS